MKQLQFITRIKGIKKRRDFLILQALAIGEKQTSVAEEFVLHKSVISRIAKRNLELLNELTLRAELATKAGRLRIAFNEIRGKVGQSKKDLLDWLEYIHKELESEKGTVINNQVFNRPNDGHLFSKEDREFQAKIMQDLAKRFEKPSIEN